MSSPTPPRLATGRALPILAVLFLGTLFLRLRGIDWLLPCLVEPDAHLAVQLDDFRSGREVAPGDTDHSKYPHLLSRMLQPLPGLADATGAADPDAHLRRAMGTILELRYLIAVLGAALAPLTFLLARRFLKTRWALLAGVLVACGPLHQHFAQQARPHGASATFVLLAVFACLRLRARPTASSYLLAGGAAALAIGSLHSGVAVLLPLAAAHLLASGTKGFTRWVLHPACAFVPIVLAVVSCYPFLFASSAGGSTSLFDWSDGGLSQSTHAVAWSNFRGGGFPRVLGFLWSYEAVTLVLAVLGLGTWLARSRGAVRPETRVTEARGAELLIVCCYALPYLFVIGLYSLTFQRFVLPLLPFVACIAAFGVGSIVDASWLARRAAGLRSALAVVLVSVTVAWPALVTWQLGTLRSRPDTLEQAAEWIAELAPVATGARVFVTPGIDLPLPRRAGVVAQDAELPHGIHPEPWIDHQARLLAAEGPDHPLFAAGYPVHRLPVRGRHEVGRLNRRPGEWLAQLDAEYLVVPLVEKKRNLVAWLLREYAIAHGERVARFSAESDPALMMYPFAYAEAPVDDPLHFGRRALRVDAVGPTVEIYRLAPGAGD